MTKKTKPVEPIEFDKDGNPIINLAGTANNDDWIRMARLKRKGKKLPKDKGMYKLNNKDDENKETS